MELNEVVGPLAAGVTKVAFRVTEPEKPFKLVRVIKENPEEPNAILRLVGLAEMPKSLMRTDTGNV